MSPKTYVVSSTEKLHAALEKANGGDRIELKPGTYEGIDIRDAYFDSAVTITSVDPDNPAVLLNKTSVKSSGNITFDSLVLEFDTPKDGYPNSGFNALLYINGSHDIQLTNSKLVGELSETTDSKQNLHEGYPYGMGVTVRDAANIVIDKNEFTTLYGGMGLNGSETVEVTNNHIHTIRKDGITITDMLDLTIEQNLFENFTPYRKNADEVSGKTDDHSDMIQYWGKGSDFGIHDLAIRDNIFLQNEGQTQSIYGRLNLKASDDPDAISFTNFEITGNLIYNGATHGLTVSGVEGAKISNNTLIANSNVLDDFRNIPKFNIKHDGLAPGEKGFSFSNDQVQTTRDLEITGNLVSYAHDKLIHIEAFDSDEHTFNQVSKALNLKVEDNYGISSRNLDDKNYTEIFPLEFIDTATGGRIVINSDAAESYDKAGSKYFYDADSLRDFFNALGTSEKFTVSTKSNVPGPEIVHLASGVETGEVLNARPTSSQSKTTSDEVVYDDEDIDLDTVNISQQELDAEEDIANAAGDEPNSAFNLIENPMDLGFLRTHNDTTVVMSSKDGNASGDILEATKIGTEGRDRKTLSTTSDDIVAGLGKNDVLRGGGGNDLLLGGAGNDRLFGNSGQDILVGGDGLNKMNGGTGNDVLIGGSDNDRLMGSSGDDTLLGGDGDDRLNGSFGKDILIGGAGSDRMHGGANQDIVVLEGEPDDYSIDLVSRHKMLITNIATNDVDVVILVEAIYFQGSDALYKIDRKAGTTSLLDPKDFADQYELLRETVSQTFTETELPDGHPLDNLLLGSDGADFIAGSANNEIVMGGAGSDEIIGSRGIDTAVYTGLAEDYSITRTGDQSFAVKHLQTGDTDQLQSVEQIYFDDVDTLYFIEDNGGLQKASRTAHAEKYDILASMDWNTVTQEDIYG